MNTLTVDLEYIGEPWEGPLLAVGVKVDGERSQVFQPIDIPSWVFEALADETLPKVTFTKADHRRLLLEGIEVNGPVHDVQVMAWAIDETTPLDLDFCAKRYLNLEMDKRIKELGGRLKFTCDDGTVVNLEDAPWKDLEAYCARDIDATYALYLTLKVGMGYDRIEDYWRQECIPLSSVLVGMETRGLPVDIQKSRRLRILLEAEMESLAEELLESTPPGFNLGSVVHLGEHLFQDEYLFAGSVPISPAQRTQLKAALEAHEAPEVDGLTVAKVGRAYAHGVYHAKGLGLKPKGKTSTGRPSTDAKTLKVHYGDQPWVKALLEYKRRATVVQTFLRNFEEMEHDGRLWGRFNQTGTKTGRLSSSGPNLQNIPARGNLGAQVRSLFRAEPGTVFVHADYSMLEPRLMAHFSQDPLLLDIFRGGKDIYLETAKVIFGRDFTKDSPERSLMKTYILAMGYGAGPDKLQETLAVAGFPASLKEVTTTLDGLKEAYRTFFDWKEEVISEATEERFVSTLAGHRRRLAVRKRGKYQADSWREIGHDERAAVNAVIQGSAADIVARLMVNVDRNLPQLRILAQVHDELLTECDRDDAEHWVLRRFRAMAETGHGFDLSVPLKFEPKVIQTWAEGKD